MIKKLRKRHLLVWALLAILLPLVFFAGLAYRHPEVINDQIPKIERMEAVDE